MGMSQWVIYCHTHITSNRRYIGLTKGTMERRWWGHCNSSKKFKDEKSFFQNAIRKYSPKSFSHHILEICYSLKDANDAEKAWIESFSSRNPEFGFNILAGGEQRKYNRSRNPWETPGFREKVSDAVKKSFDTPESKAVRKKASLDMWQKPKFREKVNSA